MSLPGDALSTPASPATLLSPDADGRPQRITDYERGGVALNDPSQGLNVADWRLRMVGTEMRISKAPYATEAVLLTLAGITELSLAFDQNMRPQVAYVQFNQAKLYWYDTALPGVTTTTLDADARSPFLTMDDKRDFATNANTNDVLLFYIRGNRLCYRQQRERFQTERTLKWLRGSSVTISKVGMNRGNRLQIDLVGATNQPLSRAFLSGWTSAIYLAGVTSIGQATPTGILAGDKLYAVVQHRSTLTTPAGWTVTATQACTNGASQTLTLLSKDSVGPADSGVTVSFTQASSGFMGLCYFVVRAESLTPTLLGSSLVAVNNVSTNAVTPPVVTATELGGELFVLIATTINSNVAITTPIPPTGASLVSGGIQNTRIAVAYQLRDQGAANGGSFTFDNGSPTNNGLAAMTLRFGTA